MMYFICNDFGFSKEFSFNAMLKSEIAQLLKQLGLTSYKLCLVQILPIRAGLLGLRNLGFEIPCTKNSQKTLVFETKSVLEYRFRRAYF